MYKMFFAFLTMFGVQTISAQTPKWDSTFRPAGYSVKVDQFKSYKDKDCIIFLGNSITAGTDWNELLHMNNVCNRGISGDITYGVLERLEEVTAGKPKKIFILIGINDIARNIPDSQILENYRTMIQRIKISSPATKIYFQTILPVNNTFPARNQFNKDEHILHINTSLKNITKEYGIFLIDLYPHFLDKGNKMDKKYTTDGLHLNAAGYALWAGILKSNDYLK